MHYFQGQHTKETAVTKRAGVLTHSVSGIYVCTCTLVIFGVAPIQKYNYYTYMYIVCKLILVTYCLQSKTDEKGTSSTHLVCLPFVFVHVKVIKVHATVRIRENIDPKAFPQQSTDGCD